MVVKPATRHLCHPLAEARPNAQEEYTPDSCAFKKGADKKVAPRFVKDVKVGYPGNVPWRGGDGLHN